MQNKRYGGLRSKIKATIAAGASVSAVIRLSDAVPVGICMPSSWTAAHLTIEVSYDGEKFYSLAHDDQGNQCNLISAPEAGSAYAINIAAMLPYSHIRLRSGTNDVPVNQPTERDIIIITRPIS